VGVVMTSLFPILEVDIGTEQCGSVEASGLMTLA
jgi:hypothetical protein